MDLGVRLKFKPSCSTLFPQYYLIRLLTVGYGRKGKLVLIYLKAVTHTHTPSSPPPLPPPPPPYTEREIFFLLFYYLRCSWLKPGVGNFIQHSHLDDKNPDK